MSSFERHHLYGDSRYRTYSQASEDQFHDALETQEGGRPLSDREAWLRSWEEGVCVCVCVCAHMCVCVCVCR